MCKHPQHARTSRKTKRNGTRGRVTDARKYPMVVASSCQNSKRLIKPMVSRASHEYSPENQCRRRCPKRVPYPVSANGVHGHPGAEVSPARPTPKKGNPSPPMSKAVNVRSRKSQPGPASSSSSSPSVLDIDRVVVEYPDVSCSRIDVVNDVEVEGSVVGNRVV